MARIRSFAGPSLLLTLLVSPCLWAQSGQASRAMAVSESATRDAARSQDRIDQLDEQTQKMLDAYRSASWEAQQLTVYAEQLEALVEAQDSEKESLQRQSDALDRTEQELLPLMLRTVDYLDKFVDLDLPFLLDERRDRVASLKKLMNDPSSSNAERFRRILEALQIELDYGRSLGAERGDVAGRSADILRLGRIELYSLSADGSQVFRWDQQEKQWQPLPHRYANRVRQGLRMAREIIAPDLISLPVSRQESVR